MSRSGEASNGQSNAVHTAGAEAEQRYKGVRRRSWGKWVSEVRVPGTRERLWLGSYATPEAAAVAYDTAVFYLRGPSSFPGLNFPGRLSPVAWHGMSPRSIQKAASDSGMAVDAFAADRWATPGRQMPLGGGGREMDGGDDDVAPIDDMEVRILALQRGACKQ